MKRRLSQALLALLLAVVGGAGGAVIEHRQDVTVFRATVQRDIDSFVTASQRADQRQQATHNFFNDPQEAFDL